MSLAGLRRPGKPSGKEESPVPEGRGFDSWVGKFFLGLSEAQAVHRVTDYRRKKTRRRGMYMRRITGAYFPCRARLGLADQHLTLRHFHYFHNFTYLRLCYFV